MTVEELMEKLEDMPKNATVCKPTANGAYDEVLSVKKDWEHFGNGEQMELVVLA